MGITHHSNYIRIMEEARTDFLQKLGWGYAQFEAEGVVSPVVSLQCEYKNTTVYGDVIDVELQVLELRAAKILFGYTMSCRGTVVFTATSAHGFLDREGRPVIVKRRFPAFCEAILELIPPREG